MPELEIVRELARKVLTISTSICDVDNFLWGRAQRLVHNTEHICQLSELTKAGLQIDHFCLTVAAYFSEAGLTGYPETRKSKVGSVICGVNRDDLLESSTEVVTKKLAGTLGKAKIDKINRIITESGNNPTNMTEAMILSDARNLDDMGIAGIFNEFRRLVSTGKGIREMLQAWRVKIDYGYWQARLKDSFKFESVRSLAEQRLFAAEYFMNQLKVETEARDLEKLSVNPVDEFAYIS